MKTAFIAVEQPQNELGNDLEGVPLKSVFPRTKAHQSAIKALLQRYYGAIKARLNECPSKSQFSRIASHVFYMPLKDKRH